MTPAGDFRHRVTIQAATETTTTSGAVVQDWNTPVLIGARWAHIEASGGRETYRARGINPEVDSVIRLRGGHLAVTQKHRVLHSDGRKWDITVVDTTDGKAPADSEEIVLTCVRGLRQGS